MLGDLNCATAACASEPQFDAISHAREQLERYWSIPYIGSSTQYLALIAEAWIDIEEVDRCKRCLDEAERFISDHGERYCEAELYRVRARVALLENAPDKSAAWFNRALEVARKQGARSLELRAAIDMTRFDGWGRTAAREVHELLSSCYRQFSEGFDSEDLREAKRLLGAGP